MDEPSVSVFVCVSVFVSLSVSVSVLVSVFIAHVPGWVHTHALFASQSVLVVSEQPAVHVHPFTPSQLEDVPPEQKPELVPVHDAVVAGLYMHPPMVPHAASVWSEHLPAAVPVHTFSPAAIQLHWLPVQVLCPAEVSDAQSFLVFVGVPAQPWATPGFHVHPKL